MLFMLLSDFYKNTFYSDTPVQTLKLFLAFQDRSHAEILRMIVFRSVFSFAKGRNLLGINMRGKYLSIL